MYPLCDSTGRDTAYGMNLHKPLKHYHYYHWCYSECTKTFSHSIWNNKNLLFLKVKFLWLTFIIYTTSMCMYVGVCVMHMTITWQLVKKGDTTRPHLPKWEPSAPDPFHSSGIYIHSLSLKKRKKKKYIIHKGFFSPGQECPTGRQPAGGHSALVWYVVSIHTYCNAHTPARHDKL